MPSPSPSRLREGSSPPLPEFAPVPRRYRHDGWTPERQKAFVEALADTGCVSRAAAMVNMAQTNCYALRRSAGAEGFRRAWDAALDFGLKRLKDIAFERAIEGQLVPVFIGGKLKGYRRKRNDALLMFCLRHYGQDASGKRTTINYFSTRASAGVANAEVRPSTTSASSGQASLRTSETGAAAEASTTTVRTVINGPAEGSAEDPAAVLEAFEGLELDSEAHAAIAAALEACAARARDSEVAMDSGGDEALLAAADDPDGAFIAVPEDSNPCLGELEPLVQIEDYDRFIAHEPQWRMAGAEKPSMLVDYEERMAAERRG